MRIWVLTRVEVGANAVLRSVEVEAVYAQEEEATNAFIQAIKAENERVLENPETTERFFFSVSEQEVLNEDSFVATVSLRETMQAFKEVFEDEEFSNDEKTHKACFRRGLKCGFILALANTFNQNYDFIKNLWKKG